MNIRNQFRYILFAVLVAAIIPASKLKAQSPPSHSSWTSILKEYVDSEGMVDYAGIKEDPAEFHKYLDSLSENPPQKSWSRAEKLAYWINVYNAFTVKLIVDNHPVESIRDLHPTLYVPGVNTVWHKEFFEIGGEETSLDHVEHGILREEFDEPRIHFAINCASFSCPELRREAFVAERLESQLQEQAVLFINDPKRNRIGENRVTISKIFKWFTGDFTENGSIIDYLNKYSKTEIDPNADVDYMDYNWELNEQ